tara:strand:- start:208 stop:1200 length:993 start_codon:yes stop_codon:yes gene_type:complete
MEDKMDKLIDLFHELDVSESTLLDIISDEKQSIDITLAALISLLLWVGDVTSEDFYEYTGVAFDTLLTHMSQYSNSDAPEVVKNNLYRGILKHAAENLNTIYSDDLEGIQGDLRAFFNAYADAVKPKIAAAGEGIQGATSEKNTSTDLIESDLLKVLESLGLDEDQRVEVFFEVDNFLIVNQDKEADTEWAWPPNLNYDAVPNPNANPNSTDWKQESVLKIHGYTVGKSRDAWHKDKRQRLLDDVMRKQLPSYVTDLFGDEYGEPMTAKRLQKLAWLLHHNAQRFLQQRNSERYAVAIEDYEEDLEFLFQTFYEEEELKFQSPHLSWPWG